MVLNGGGSGDDYFECTELKACGKLSNSFLYLEFLDHPVLDVR